MNETDIRKAIQLACSKGESRLFRNQVGEAWQGRCYRTAEGVLVRDPRRVNFGLCVGSADLVGWRTVTITPDMVGQRVAVFASVEVKTTRGRYAAGQREWAEQVVLAGGLAGFAKNTAEADKILGALSHES